MSKYVNFSDTEVEELIQKLQDFITEHEDKIKEDHITIGLPGTPNSLGIAEELEDILVDNGYSVRRTSLQTFNPPNKKYDISNAPDDSVMVELY